MLREIKLTMNKTQAEINREWDIIVPARDAQQRSGDVSFLRVLRPWIGSAVRDARCILDVGCGSGRLTQTLRAAGARVVGVDPSPRSIALAQSSDPVGIYHAGTLEQFAAENQQERFDLAVANMVLMDAPDLDGSLPESRAWPPAGASSPRWRTPRFGRCTSDMREMMTSVTAKRCSLRLRTSSTTSASNRRPRTFIARFRATFRRSRKLA